jgi:transposase
LCFADQRRGKEVGSVLLELTVAEQRCNAVMEVLRDGLTVIEVAERFGVSRQAIHSWLRRYASGGLDALADRSHRPLRCPQQMPTQVEARLCELRRLHPHWGQRRLAHELVRQGIDPPPGLTSIYRALVRNGLIQPRPAGAPRPAGNAGNAAGRWSCGSWTSWVASG